MEIPDAPRHPEPYAGTALDYRRLHRDHLMIRTKLRGPVAEKDELCRVCSVDTLAPGLWITVRFLDGSVRSFRPDAIRQATADEVRASAAQS